MYITPDKLVAQLKTIADLVRMRLVALCLQGECSVSELTEITGQSQPRVSQHLKALCEVGLLASQRDGKRVFYRVPSRSEDNSLRARLFDLIPTHDSVFIKDQKQLWRIRGDYLDPSLQLEDDNAADRSVYSIILDLTVTSPVGSLLDIGCGRGQILKLLASRSSRAIGVDIDSGARQLARAELMLAGVPNCSLRQGDMYQLPFESGEFDTIILDDVLGDADKPVQALQEAARLLRPGGQLLLLLSLKDKNADKLRELLKQWGAASSLTLAPARIATRADPTWLLAVATAADAESAAA